MPDQAEPIRDLVAIRVDQQQRDILAQVWDTILRLRVPVKVLQADADPSLVTQTLADAPPASEVSLPAKQAHGALVKGTVEIWTAETDEEIQTVEQRLPLFRRGNDLIKLYQDENGDLSIVYLTKDDVFGILFRFMDWVHQTSSGFKPAKPPKDICKDVVRIPDPRLPRLERIVHYPIFLADGTFLSTPGYHAEHQLYYYPSPELHDLAPFRPRFATTKMEDILEAARSFGTGSPRARQTKLGTLLHQNRERVFAGLQIQLFRDQGHRGRYYRLQPMPEAG
ncbi:MAG: hypothetical protein C4523_12240 [Myxococcales bacterium]|nr:MAG: hypothetical protein C4523_12240 [Myxococcales bacterium]